MKLPDPKLVACLNPIIEESLRIRRSKAVDWDKVESIWMNFLEITPEQYEIIFQASHADQDRYNMVLAKVRDRVLSGASS